MPVFVEWKWIEKTETFLAVFHFWDDGKKENLRIRVNEMDFETLAIEGAERTGGFVEAVTLPGYGLDYARANAYLSWAPSHAEFCLLTEILTYANLINGFKPDRRRKLRANLQGRTTTYASYQIDVELLHAMPDNTIVSFAKHGGLSFQIRLEYIEYLRKLIKPYI